MNTKEKQYILSNNYRHLLLNRLCGDYIRVCGEDVNWTYEARKYNYNLLAFTSKGVIKCKYDFSETFNQNLCNLVDKIYNKLEVI